MKSVKPSITFIDPIDGEAILMKLEKSARKCYQSESTSVSSVDFVKDKIKRGHTSILEHVQLTFDVITDRGVTHEWVRHRHASYSQESTRYVRYDGHMEFIEPIELMDRPHLVDIWYNGCINSEKGYRDMMALGATAQEARALLNNSLKTEIRVSMNLRSLRNFLELRCAKNAHTHIKELTIPLLFMLKEKIPGIFDDIPWDKTFENKYLSEDRWREYFPDEMNK